MAIEQVLGNLEMSRGCAVKGGLGLVNVAERDVVDDEKVIPHGEVRVRSYQPFRLFNCRFISAENTQDQSRRKAQGARVMGVDPFPSLASRFRLLKIARYLRLIRRDYKKPLGL